MFPMPNLGNIGELFLIQNLKTGIYYIDACFIIMLLVFIHHVDISMYFKKSVDFIWSTNRQSIKQTFVSLTKGNMHKIHYKGTQYATSYSSATIYINYPDPVIHVLDYYSDIIDSRRGEKGDKKQKQIQIKKRIENMEENCVIDEISIADSESSTESESESECECYYHDYMDYYECDACKEKAKNTKTDELFNLQYVEVLDKNHNESKIYTPKTNLPVEIEDGVYLSVEKIPINRESKSGGGGAVDFKKIVFTIMTSRKNNITKIYDFLKKCEDVYTKKIESRMTDKIFIYEFIQSEANGGRGGGGGGYNDDDDGSYGRRNQKMSNILCSEYELISTKNLKTNCFFTDVDKIIKRIDFFINNKEWYQARGIPYQLGFLFFGPPGCGKTSTIKAIAQLLQRHIVNINDIDKIKKVTDLKNIFYGDYINGQYIPTNKRIYVIDEFDKILDSITAKKINNANATANAAAASAMAAFNMQMMGLGGLGGVGGVEDDIVLSKVIAVDSDTSSNEGGVGSGGSGGGGDEGGKRKRKGSGDGGPNANANGNLNLAGAANMKPKYSFNDADMLTIMDGLVETSGRIIICTANDPSKISETFKRPGRLDEHIEFTKCTQKMTIQLLELFYNTKLGSELLEKISNAGSNIEYKYSPAEINKICFHNVDNIGGAVDEIVG
jgi:hypothetical protein